MLGFVWRRKGILGSFGEDNLFGEVKKNEMECKGFVYMCFGICKGGGNCIERRGPCVKVEA